MMILGNPVRVAAAPQKMQSELQVTALRYDLE
jgi:hypothetical protein